MRTAALALTAAVWLVSPSAHAQPESPYEAPAEPPMEAAPEPEPTPVEQPAPEPIAPATEPAPAGGASSPYAQPWTSPYAQPSTPPYAQPAGSPYAQPGTSYAPAPNASAPSATLTPAAPAEAPAPTARRWWGAFEFRFGGSTGFAQLDTGVGLHRHHGYGGFVGMEFAQPIASIADFGSIFFALTWNAIELRNSDPEGWVVGGTDAGAGAGVRMDLDVETYVQVWAGYFFAGDSQAVYPDAGDLIAMWHLAYARARFRVGILAVELGGGVGTGEHFLVGLRLRLADSFWLGADLNAYFAGREQHPARWGRELWITRAFFAIRWE